MFLIIALGFLKGQKPKSDRLKELSQPEKWGAKREGSKINIGGMMKIEGTHGVQVLDPKPKVEAPAPKHISISEEQGEGAAVDAKEKVQISSNKGALVNVEA